MPAQQRGADALMKLGDWIKQHNWSYLEFGAALSPPVNRGTVARWVSGAAKPIKHMEAIFVLTAGAVAPNDFWDIAARPRRPARVAA